MAAGTNDTNNGEFTERCIETPGNASGWAGVAFHPTETDVSVRDADHPDSTKVVRGLLPYETVVVVIEAGPFREAVRAIPGGAGILRVETDGHTVTSPDDPHLSVQVGDTGEIRLRGHYFTDFADKAEQALPDLYDE